MRVSIQTDKKMVMVHLFLTLEVDTRENLKMVILMARVFTTIVQEIFTWVSGRTT